MSKIYVPWVRFSAVEANAFSAVEANAAGKSHPDSLKEAEPILITYYNYNQSHKSIVQAIFFFIL